MKGIIKWVLAAGGLFVILAVAAVVLIPRFVDVQKYKPRIEKFVSEQTGRSFSMGDDIDLSFFPWVGVRLSDLSLGSSKGFAANKMILVKGFEVRLKVLPLLSRQVEVKTFVVDTPQIFLEKRKDGRANWEGIGKSSSSKISGKKEKESLSKDGDLPVKSLLVGNFSILNGLVSYVDHQTGMDKKITDLNLNLTDISLDRPVGAVLSAKIDGKPLSVKTKIKGSASAVTLSDGVLTMDDSKLIFSAAVKDFEKPDIMFDLDLDQINLDNYLPLADKKEQKNIPSPEKTDQAKTDQEKTTSVLGKTGKKEPVKSDYSPLRKMVVDGKIKIGRLVASNVKIQDFAAHLTGKDGVLNLNPLSFNLYQGSVMSKAVVDVRKNDPAVNFTLDVKGVQAGPLFKDAASIKMIEGTLKAGMDLAMTGDSPDMIKQSLKGKGEMVFEDGAIVGIDLANAVRNVTSKIGLADKPAEKPRTDFAELKMPFSADKGIASVQGASLNSPLLRIMANGNAHLLEQTLDFRVEPKFVATLKGQGDTKERSGLMVPVLITGTFETPKIRPDLKGMLGGANSENLKKMIDNKKINEAEIKAIEQDAKNILKNLMPGLKN